MPDGIEPGGERLRQFVDLVLEGRGDPFVLGIPDEHAQLVGLVADDDDRLPQGGERREACSQVRQAVRHHTVPAHLRFHLGPEGREVGLHALVQPRGLRVGHGQGQLLELRPVVGIEPEIRRIELYIRGDQAKREPHARAQVTRGGQGVNAVFDFGHKPTHFLGRLLDLPLGRAQVGRRDERGRGGDACDVDRRAHEEGIEGFLTGDARVQLVQRLGGGHDPTLVDLVPRGQ